ncbi:MAG: rhodanese-like domain-containing protein [Leptolyngbya sp. Prado105]|jgi:rhodanese-related sulfurtransferase|nr:rhodanese-like domain-containing protein [Leptolyngbya sp. Prado105]
MRILFNLLKLWIRLQFPTVRSLSTEDLDRWLSDPSQKPPTLLDARSPVEFAVSHLKSAQQEIRDLSQDEAIVVYCSIGYRSARVAQQLQQQGFTNVQNLEGSIFQWANEGRSLYRGQQLAHKVHPYNAQWGKLLQPKYRDLPDS